MSYVVVGCDVNQGNDSTVQNTVAKALEKQGHTVEKLAIKPGPFAAYDWGEKGNPRGKIGVYIIADGIFSIADRYNNPNGFKYVYFIIRGDLVDRPKMRTRKDFETRPIGADGDCTGICAKLRGKTFVEIDKIVKNRCRVLFGTNAKEMADELIKAMGGKVNSSSSSKSDSASSCKEALTDVLYNWDGEVECYIRDDTVHIRKIPSPSTATLSLIEGQNIDLGSINVTDYNPSTVNYLSCTFKDYTLSIKDDYLIKRFGKISSTVKVDKSIKKLDDAKKFIQREWNKLKRDNGHSLELKTYGHSKWRIGEWCRVYLPSFNIDDYMYITKVSQDDSGDSEWSCNLTLVDYPPGFGEPNKTETDEKKSKGSDSS